MGILRWAASKYIEKRGIDDPQYWINTLTEAINKTGQLVTADTALQQSTVLACVRVLAETIASLPLMVYKRKKSGGKDVATDYPLYGFLHDSPNPFQTSYEFREMQVGHISLRGNCYAFVQRDQTDRVINIIPLHPDKIQKVEIQDDYTLRYTYVSEGRTEIFDQKDRDLWHIKGLSSDGIIGLSSIKMIANSVGLSMAAEEHGIAYYKNGAKHSGIVKLPGSLKEDAKARLQKSIQDATTGGNKFRVLVFEGGMDWENIGISNEDSQYLETRNFQVTDIARAFRVPLMLIGYPETQTYASAEQFMLSFVTHTIRPWLVRIEQSINKHLIPEKDQGIYFAEFKAEGLLRGDIQSRYSAYQIARQGMWMSANEIRDLENMNPIDGGDEYVNPNTTVSEPKGDPNSEE